MKISELIEKLKKTHEDFGDLEVHAWPYDGQSIYCKPDGTLDDIHGNVCTGTLIVFKDMKTHIQNIRNNTFEKVEMKILIIEPDQY